MAGRVGLQHSPFSDTALSVIQFSLLCGNKTCVNLGELGRSFQASEPHRLGLRCWECFICMERMPRHQLVMSWSPGHVTTLRMVQVGVTRRLCMLGHASPEQGGRKLSLLLHVSALGFLRFGHADLIPAPGWSHSTRVPHCQHNGRGKSTLGQSCVFTLVYD